MSNLAIRVTHFVVFLSLFFAVACSDNRRLQRPGYLMELENLAAFMPRVRAHQEHAESVYRRGCYFQEKGKHRLALIEFETIIRMDPRHFNAYNAMGVSYDQLGQFELAQASYHRALEINPDLDHVQNNFGYSLLLQGKVDPAIEYFKRAIRLNGKKQLYHNNLGLAYSEKGLLQLALKEFGSAGGPEKANSSEKAIFPVQGPKGKRSDTKASDQLHGKTRIRGTLEEVGKSKDRTIELAIGAGRHLQNSPAGAGKENGGMTPESAGRSLRLPFSRQGLERGQDSARIQPVKVQDHFFRGSCGSMTGERERCGEEAEIEISNGNGVIHMAKRVGAYLRSKGFPVKRLTNSKHFHHARSMIYYCEGYLQEAYQVAKEIPGWNEMKEVPNLESPSVKVKVLIGRDLIGCPNFLRERRAGELLSQSVRSVVAY